MLRITPEIEEKRSKKVILWSGLYLLGSFISLQRISISGTDFTEFHPIDVLVYFSVAVSIPNCFFLWEWVKSLIITSRSIQPEGFGYRDGWAFWGWITPVFSWWVPKRLIDNTSLIFAIYTGRDRLISTTKWWAIFVSSSIIGILGFNIGSQQNAFGTIASIISTVLLALAFPLWKKVVEETSLAHQAALVKLSLTD